MPTVVLVTAPFEAAARAAARARGVSDLVTVVLDADLEERAEADVRTELQRRLPEILGGLARE